MPADHSKPFLHVVNLNGIPILSQLRYEEALLRADEHNWCLFNRGSPLAIVMGISGQVEQLIHQEKLKKEPIPLIRRYSGGGTVVVDENTGFVTLICRTDAVAVQPFPKQLMRWSAELYRPLFPSHPFELRENDYVIGEQKWGGNAQCITKGRWVHHTSMLWDYHPATMDYLLLPAKAPAYRQERPHTEFLCRLRDYWAEESFFQTALLEQLSRQFNLIPVDKGELEQILTLPHRKSTCLVE